MKRIYILFLLTGSLLCGAMQAQEKYNIVLDRTKGLSPYEAIYVLMDYQTRHPEYASIYYHLGNLSYDLLPTRDPLHHYKELSTLLYRSRLFYGNCLHFAKDQKLAGWQFEDLAKGEKRIEYAALEQFVRPRLEEVQRQQSACDSIHRSFVRMSERYGRCQQLFTSFLNRYTREKTAHLQLQPEEEQLLQSLRQAADSLDGDIAAFQQALTLQPVEGYHPVFRKEPILLYRLDGLTYTDFLQNDIAVWDYSRWAQQFLNEQHQVYDRLYKDLDREQLYLARQLAQYAAGQTIPGQLDASLPGRCARLELQTPQVDSIKRMQEQVRNCVAQQTVAASDAPQTIREMIPLLQIAVSRRDAEEDEALLTMKTSLIDLAQPLRIQQQAVYIHPVSGEAIDYKAEQGEKVHCLLPDDTGYRCVITDADNNLRVLVLYHDRTIRAELMNRPGEQALLFTKIPGQIWVLVTDKDIYWLN